MIKLYSKPNCPNCTKLKQRLDNASVTYEVIDITKHPMDHAFLIKEGHRSVPQLYKDGVLLDLKQI